MAIAPLFVADLATLQSRLRLSGAASTDALAIIGDVLLQVRMGMYNALGQDRVNQILLTAHSDNPTTDAQLNRIKAEVCETTWTRYYLLRRLPHLFVDGSGSAQQDWNQEGLAREIQPNQYEVELSRLDAEVQSYLSELSGDDQGAIDTLQISTIGPTVQPAPVGTSIYNIGCNNSNLSDGTIACP